MINEWFKKYFGLQYIIGDNTKAFGFSSLDERVNQDVNEITEYSRLKDNNQKILDIPCGYGKHAIELATRIDDETYGLDINNKLIDIAQYRRDKKLDTSENPINLKGKLKFMAGDIRNFSDTLNNFDLIYSWFWSLGYFSEEENIKTIHELYSALKSNGILLVQTIPKENLQNYISDTQRETFPLKIMGQKYPKGILYFTKVYEPKDNILHTAWITMLENGEIIPQQPIISSVKMYSTDEYIKMFKETGFKNVEVYKSYFPFKVFRSKKWQPNYKKQKIMK